MPRFKLIGVLAVVLLWGMGPKALAGAAPTAQQPSAPAQNRRGEDRERFQGVAGTIVALQGNELTLKTSEGKEVAVKLSEKTRYRKEGKETKLDDFKVGDAVFVRGEPAGENSWVAQAVVSRSNFGEGFREGLGKQFIAGEIQAIEGTMLTILRIDNETQTIQVDEETSFRKQGESITLADLKPGDRVFGRGTVKAGVFVPAVLNVGELRPGPMSPRKDSPEPR